MKGPRYTNCIRYATCTMLCLIVIFKLRALQRCGKGGGRRGGEEGRRGGEGEGRTLTRPFSLRTQYYHSVDHWIRWTW